MKTAIRKWKVGRYILRGRARWQWTDPYTGKRRQQYEHRFLWEQAHGPIPDGFEIHHEDGDPLNNDLSNLRLMRFGEHRRHHGRLRTEQVERNGTRRCSRCREWRPFDEFGKRRDGPRQGLCKKCNAASSLASWHKRRAALTQEAA